LIFINEVLQKVGEYGVLKFRVHTQSQVLFVTYKSKINKQKFKYEVAYTFSVFTDPETCIEVADTYYENLDKAAKNFQSSTAS
jgi:hypothetical protein